MRDETFYPASTPNVRGRLNEALACSGLSGLLIDRNLKWRLP
jgi:hypothetical protein